MSEFQNDAFCVSYIEDSVESNNRNRSFVTWPTTAGGKTDNGILINTGCVWNGTLVPYVEYTAMDADTVRQEGSLFSLNKKGGFNWNGMQKHKRGGGGGGGVVGLGQSYNKIQCQSHCHVSLYRSVAKLLWLVCYLSVCAKPIIGYCWNWQLSQESNWSL